MSLLNPLFLIGAVAVAGPILIHLFRRQESRKVPFSSLMFVTHAPSRSWRRLRLRRLLLFATRVTAVLLLVLAFSRPYFSRSIEATSASSHKTVALLIDTSFSMRAADRMARARQEALTVINRLGPQDSALLISFSDVSQALNQPHASPKVLPALVNSLAPGFRRTDYAQALKFAAQALASTPNQATEIHLISDFQRSGWAEPSGEATLPEDVKLVSHDVSSGDPANAHVEQLEILSTGGREQPRLKVAVRLSSNQTQSVPATLEVNGKTIEVKTVNLEAGKSQLVEFAEFSQGSGLTRGVIRLDWPDALPDDNQAFFAVNSQSREKLLVLSEEESVGDDLYLKKALGLAGPSSFDVVIQTPRTAGNLDLSAYSAVVLNNPARPGADLAEKLTAFVGQGGGLVVILGDRADPQSLNSALGEILPGRVIRKKMEPDNVALIGNIQRRHSIFKVFEPVHLSYFLTTPFRSFVECEAAPGSSVLVELEGGHPLLVERAVGRGRSLLVTSAFTTAWSDLPLRSVFLPLCQELAKYAMGFQGGTSGFTVGEDVPIARLSANLARTVERAASRTSAFSTGWKVVAPSGAEIPLTEEDLTRSPFITVDQPGFYRTTVRNVEDSLAVNLSPLESDLGKLEAPALLASIKRTPSSAPASKVASGLPLEERQAWESRQGIWWFLALAALIVLLAEAFLANRYRDAGEGGT